MVRDGGYKLISPSLYGAKAFLVEQVDKLRTKIDDQSNVYMHTLWYERMSREQKALEKNWNIKRN